VRVDLPSGEPEVLVSSLTDLQAYPTAILLIYITNAGELKKITKY
jgi:hypothetical protein